MTPKFIPVFLIALLSADVFAQDATLQQCQRYKDQTDRYQQLRRQGGHGEQMDQWKNKMREYQQQYRDGNCHKYRHQLKR